MKPILDSLPFEDIIVYDNSKLNDVKVAGRYFATVGAKNDIIYTQDDDCLVNDIEALLEQYEEGKILANMYFEHGGDYSDNVLVGWGSLFDKQLAQDAFQRYFDAGYSIEDDVFYRCADVIFTSLTPFKRISVGHTSFDYAYFSDRMYNQPYHDKERDEVRERCRKLK